MENLRPTNFSRINKENRKSFTVRFPLDFFTSIENALVVKNKNRKYKLTMGTFIKIMIEDFLNQKNPSFLTNKNLRYEDYSCINKKNEKTLTITFPLDFYEIAKESASKDLRLLGTYIKMIIKHQLDQS